VYALHISERKNRDSILAHVILPSRVRYEHHRDLFVKLGIISQEKDKVSYFWADSEKNEKYIKDMIYCKNWLHYRDDMCENHINKYNDFLNISTVDDNLYKYENNMFDIYRVKTNDYPHDKLILHAQFPNSDKFSPNYRFSDKFIHDDKVLLISNKPKKNLEIIGSVIYEYDWANKTMRFSFINI